MTNYNDKLCRKCVYGDKTEYEKPCIIYSDNCKHYKPIQSSDEVIPFITGISTDDEIISKYETWSNDNEACKYCNNNPKNGGSGICQCILGTPKIT